MSTENVTQKPKIVFEWNKKLGNYLCRWRLDFYFFSFRVHKWLCSDDERAYHSHPNNMLSFIIKGSYCDHYLKDEKRFTKIRSRFSFHIIRREFKHYVEILEKPTWTILFTWGIPKRWSFWLKETLRRKTRDKYFLEHGHHVCDT